MREENEPDSWVQRVLHVLKVEDTVFPAEFCQFVTNVTGMFIMIPVSNILDLVKLLWM
jgi:hypothetical protein